MKRIDIALQGGGSHGAFTWGVLDRLLELDDIEIVGISGTSAGAMNAIALAQGLSEGGPEHARELLHTYWDRVSKASSNSPIQRTFWNQLSGNWSLEHSPGFAFSKYVQRVASPYQFNPFDINPLEDLVRECFDFDVINANTGPRVFLSATNVRTGRPKIFRQPDITVESVMASACLPQVFKAVEIDGEAYWDGGFVGNPPLFPLVDETDAHDILIVQLNPLERAEIPKTPYGIENRLNEITFNASLGSEIRAIALLWEVIAQESLDRDAYQEARFHRIHAQDTMNALSSSSKMNAEKSFLDYLFEVGRDTTDAWIENNYAHVGEKSTWLPHEFLEESLKPGHLSEGTVRRYRK